MRRQKPTCEAEQKYQADVALSAQRAELLDAARKAESRLRQAQARRVPEAEIRLLAEDLDAALTAAMRAAYAAQRAEIGLRGYDDRIYRRKAKAKPSVHALTAEAEHLLTLRETHRLNGIPAVEFKPGPLTLFGREARMSTDQGPSRDRQAQEICGASATAAAAPAAQGGLMRAAWSSPQRKLRTIIAVAATMTGAATLYFSIGIGVTFLAFGVFAAGHMSFDIAVTNRDPETPPALQQSNQTGPVQFIDTTQAAVITAAATILGLITAFSGSALPGAAKVGVVALGGGILVMFVSRSSQARLSSAKAARTLGLLADVIGVSLFTLGIIGIIVSLLITGGLGAQGSGHGHAAPSSYLLVRTEQKSSGSLTR